MTTTQRASHATVQQHLFNLEVLFPLGRTCMTPGIARLVTEGRINPATLLERHSKGDWHVFSEDDHRANKYAVRHNQRILTAYPIDPTQPCEGYGENCVWIITEWDRSVTTMLLPEDY